MNPRPTIFMRPAPTAIVPAREQIRRVLAQRGNVSDRDCLDQIARILASAQREELS